MGIWRIYASKESFKDVQANSYQEALVNAGYTPATQNNVWAWINFGNDELPNDSFSIMQRGQKIKRNARLMDNHNLSFKDAFKALAMPVKGFQMFAWVGDRWVDTRRLNCQADRLLSNTFPYTYQAKSAFTGAFL